MRVLGIDPGLRVTGWGIVDEDRGTLSHVCNGEIKTNDKDPFPRRLKTIYDNLVDIIIKHHPDLAAVEDIFFARDVRAALKLGQSRGVAILAASNIGVEIFEYPALEVKKAVVGYGRASKSQVQYMVGKLLALKNTAPHNASDALAVAICHIHTSQFLRKGNLSGH